MRFLTLAFLTAAYFLTTTQETISYLCDCSYALRDAEIEVNHLNAALIINPHDTLVHGEAEFTFRTLREQIDPIVFGVSGLDVEWITIDGVEAVFSKKRRNAIIYPPVEPG